MSITTVVVVVTVLVSILLFYNRDLFEQLSFSAYRIVKRNEWYRLISHGFVHADWVHLFVNMFTFYSFGTYVEQIFAVVGFSRWSFLLLYFGGMIVASLYDLLKRNNDPYYLSVGASGAVSAVLFCSIFFDPWNKIYLFAAIPIPGILFGVAYLFYCQYMAKRGGDNINHNAHLYGALYGFVFPIFLSPSLWRIFVNQLLSGW